MYCEKEKENVAARHELAELKREMEHIYIEKEAARHELAELRRELAEIKRQNEYIYGEKEKEKEAARHELVELNRQKKKMYCLFFFPLAAYVLYCLTRRAQQALPAHMQ